MAITLLLGIPFGVAAAVYRGRAVDVVVRMLAAVGQSLPQFWVGLVLMQIFAIHLRLLPVAEMGNPASYVLPGVTLGVYVLASVTRLLRSSMLEVLDSEYIREARIKGVSEASVIWKHALRNALIPVVTFSGLYLTFFIVGAVVVESIFAWPGAGRLLVQGIMQRDYPVVQACIIFKSSAIIAMNLLVDLIYPYIDPRIREA
jgi:peptide/nickel transport system permease protein